MQLYAHPHPPWLLTVRLSADGEKLACEAASALTHLEGAEHAEEALADDKAEQQVHAAGHRQARAARLQGVDLQTGCVYLGSNIQGIAMTWD